MCVYGVRGGLVWSVRVVVRVACVSERLRACAGPREIGARRDARRDFADARRSGRRRTRERSSRRDGGATAWTTTVATYAAASGPATVRRLSAAVSLSIRRAAYIVYVRAMRRLLGRRHRAPPDTHRRARPLTRRPIRSLHKS